MAGTDGSQTVVASGLADPVAVAVPADEDDDGIADLYDNCPNAANASQPDTDADGAGNACDADDDNDGLTDVQETTGGTNPLLPDTDGDAADNCPLEFNVSQADAEADGTGDACDATPAPPADPDPDPTPAPAPDADPGTDPAGEDEAPAGESPSTSTTGTTTSTTIGTPTPAFDPRVAAPVAATDPAPQPQLGKIAAAAGVTGRVLVRLPGAAADVPLDADGAIPVGATVDTTGGAVVLTTALPDGRVQSARFSGGRFVIAQRRADGVTDLRLTGPGPACGSRPVARATAKRAKRSRTKRLWGEGHGRFRTHGRNSVATVRGTK